MTSQAQAILQSTLGILLGFDDGAEDILGHLLTIESKADLSEYLNQLLGRNSAEIGQFVENVCRFQKGEPLVIEGESQSVSASQTQEKQPTSQNVEVPSVSQKKPQNAFNKASTALEGRRNKQNLGKKSRVPPPKASTSHKSPPSSSSTAADAPRNQQSASNGKISSASSSDSSPPKPPPPAIKEPVVEKSHPTRGKATKVCGCFGTKHKPLTNCLYCGRILCELEGYGFCAFCGYMVEEIQGGEGKNDAKAWLQKERLLRFDREFARRTQIFDDQADYQQHTSWMTEEEKLAAEDKEEERLQAMRQPKQTMNLAI